MVGLGLFVVVEKEAEFFLGDESVLLVSAPIDVALQNGGAELTVGLSFLRLALGLGWSGEGRRRREAGRGEEV